MCKSSVREISVKGVIERIGLSVPVMLIVSSTLGVSIVVASGSVILKTGRSRICCSGFGVSLGSPIGSYS